MSSTPGTTTSSGVAASVGQPVNATTSNGSSLTTSAGSISDEPPAGPLHDRPPSAEPHGRESQRLASTTPTGSTGGAKNAATPAASKNGKPRAHGSTGGVRKSGPGRKPRACAECKKQKMKCEVLPGHASCRNCLRRNLECAIKNAAVWADSAHAVSHAQSDRPLTTTDACEYTRKLDVMRVEIQQMKQSIDALLQQGAAPSRGPSASLHRAASHGSLETPQNTTSSPAGTTLSAREDNTHMAMTRENSLEPMPAGDYANGAVTVDEPMGSLYEVTRLRNIRSNRTKMVRPPRDGPDGLDDFISKGVISEAEAEELYKIFHTSLNHYLWVGLEQTHPSFESVRKSSELLTATILTVTALHIPTSAETFDKCYKEFLSLISSSMFSRYHSIDDVRGLCVAAFWLSDVSWKLSGHAIRIATELNIHQSFSRALEGDREHFFRARLWYMLYVCDHHFSIAYGRPPMIAESQQIREHESFLASPFANAVDQRICSQVNLMQILTRIYGRFSVSERPTAVPSSSSAPSSSTSPPSAMLSESDLSELRNFNLEIDQWRMRWHARQHLSPYIGTFPPKGIILYSYFAKLQLNSLAVRGVSLRAAGQPPQHMSTERKEFANMGISAAASILTFVLEEADLRRALVGTPLYVHTMIAFASVFLMKMAAQWDTRDNRQSAGAVGGGGLNIETGYVSQLLRRMIELLKSSVTSERHLLYHIAAGLEKMLDKMLAKPQLVATTMSMPVPPLPPSSSSSAAASAAATMGPGMQASAASAASMSKNLLVNSVQPRDHMGPVAGQQPVDYSVPGGPPMLPTTQQQQQQQHQPDVGAMGPGVPLAAFQESPAGWDALSGTLSGQEVFAAEMPLLNNNIIYEAFGSESSNDVYNLLTSQFSY